MDSATLVTAAPISAARFPAHRYDQIASFAEDYLEAMRYAMEALDRQQLAQAASCLTAAIKNRATIFVCGNGGSAAIANHLLCDFMKGIQTGTTLMPRVVSLAAQVEMMLAIANDLSFEDIFLYQLRTQAEPGDVLLTISSSGNSENIVRAVTWAGANGLRTIGLTGFDGGRVKGQADISLHIPAHNYGIVEDCHHSLMHLLAQYIRHHAMADVQLGITKF